MEKWTVADVGNAFDRFRNETLLTNELMKKEVDLIKLTVEKISEKVDKMDIVLRVGNGEPSLREQTRKHTDWINTANKMVWIFLTVFIAQAVAMVISVILEIQKLKGI